MPAQITEFKIEDGSDIHLVLFGDGSYLIAELPAAKCRPKKARDRKAMIAACGELRGTPSALRR